VLFAENAILMFLTDHIKDRHLRNLRESKIVELIHKTTHHRRRSRSHRPYKITKRHDRNKTDQQHRPTTEGGSKGRGNPATINLHTDKTQQNVHMY